MDKARELLNESKFPQAHERFGAYTIEALIDEDKSGRVYKATGGDPEKVVSLKILSPDLARNPSFLDVLRVQMQTACSIQHPGIPSLQDIGSENGLHYIVTEWCSSGWLSQQMIQSGKFTLSEALELIVQCAETLQATAEIKIFHGNLRLNNILVFPDGDIKITEIGFAAAVRALFGAASLPVYLGAARFLAPEMTIPGAIVDHRADIYSLGLILYFLLFSVTPFRYEGEKLTASGELSEVDSMDEVLKVISKMTENRVEKRYQDYESLLRDLRVFLVRSTPSIQLPFVKSSGAAIKNQKLFKLLCVLYASGSNGVVTTLDNGARRIFYIRDREVVYFESNQPDEIIWNWLIEKKEFDPKNRPLEEESLSRSVNRLLTRNMIRMEDFRFRYQELASRTLSEVLKNTTADAEFLTAEIDGAPLCVVRLSGLLLKAARYNVDLKDVLREIKSDCFLNRTGLFDSLVKGFSFTTEENLLVTVSQEGIYTGSLQASAGSSNEKGLRFLYLLKQIGALEIRTTQNVSTSTSASTSEPPNVQPVVEEHFELEAETPEINVKKDSVRMEVQRTAIKADIERLDVEAEKRFEQAKECYKTGKYWEASNLCEQALTLHEDGRYYWLMGMSYAQHARFRHKSEDCFHRAIKLDPFNDEFHVELADFYITNGLLLRARTHCKKALEIVPDQIRAHEMLESTLFSSLGPGGCCCEHDPGCNHSEHKAWRK
jgi:serine/threonine protein kinase